MISSVISNRLRKLLAIQIAGELPVVYTGDLKLPRNHHEIAAKIAAKITGKITSINGPLGDTCRWENNYIVPELHQAKCMAVLLQSVS